MPLFAVSLLSECHLAGSPLPTPMREVAIHVVQARDEVEACTRGAEIGSGRKDAYRNMDGENVSWVFQRVVECQTLYDRDLADGMEVSSWLYEGERLCLNDGWSMESPEQAEFRPHPKRTRHVVR